MIPLEDARTATITPDVDDDPPAAPRESRAPVEQAVLEPMVQEPDRRGTVSSGWAARRLGMGTVSTSSVMPPS